jgi:hypothetical protein
MEITLIMAIIAVVIIWGGVLCFARNPIVAALLLIFLRTGFLLWAFVEVIMVIFR